MNNSFATTVESGITNLVVKEVSCLWGNLHFILSNKNNRPISGMIEITAFDSDKDPIGNAEVEFSLKGISGDSFSAKINCLREGGEFKFKAVK